MLENGLILEQKQTISTNQVQSLEILNFTNQELDSFLINEYMENPLIESSSNKEDDMLENLEHMYEKSLPYKDQYIQWQDEDCNRKSDIKAPDPDEMFDFILGQLNSKNYSKKEWTLMNYMIKCLDDKGFFIYDTTEISNILGYDERLVIHCLEELKKLEPAGIFSRDISECLKIQLIRKGITDEALVTIIDNYMFEIIEGHISDITRNMHLSSAKVKEYMHMIGSLNPRPIMNMQGDTPQYIVPDILVEYIDNDWRIKINDKWMGEYKYNDYYIRMMQTAQDKKLKDYFTKKLQRAKFIFDCIEQRRSTITTVMKNILHMQDKHLREGSPLVPMTLEDIALKSDLHISTVSRAIKGKYMQYHKTILIKDLFSASVSSDNSDNAISSSNIKELIKEIVNSEDRKKPLSDQKIANILSEKGIDISRRAIAKYRIQEGILDSRQRKYF